MFDSTSPHYVSSGYSANIPTDIINCYLCGKVLAPPTTFDHIVPNDLFALGDPCRPKLPVHAECNNSKSKDDKWFIKQLQLRSSFNPEAEHELSQLIDQAIIEQPDAYIIGKHPRHLIFAKGIFNKVNWELELKYKNQSLMQIRLHKDDVQRFSHYIETLCQGLFIRNVPSSKPAIPKLMLRQNVDLELKGQDNNFVKTVKDLIDKTSATRFGQQWGNKMCYIGSRIQESPDKGYLFIQFYSQFCILAWFI